MDRNPLHADFYADRACQYRVRVIENVRLARDTYRVRFDCPAIARRIVPGQFLMLRLAGLNDPLLGRPLALYDTVLDAAGEPMGIDVVYLTLGKMTRHWRSSTQAHEFDIWGPLGNGFPTAPSRTPHHGRRRHRPDAVPGARPGIFGRAPLRRASPDGRTRQASHAVLRRTDRRTTLPALLTSRPPASMCDSAAMTEPSATTVS